MPDFLSEKDEQHPPVPLQRESASEELSALCKDAKKCRKCSLAETRLNLVFGEGDPCAKLVVIGEAPGAEEDASGRPFVGRSGQLLDKILSAAGFARKDVYICNILKCRPPGNRNPLASEIACCTPWLLRQLQIVHPQIILVLGKVAANTLFGNNLSLGSMRGRVIQWKEYDCFITYHPAALLRNPSWKHGCWEDIQRMMRHYAEITEQGNALDKHH
ncbi:MAG: uracil-DNA glycosylase [Chlorobiaceae bacterium]|nr:uracil-DNA glycosylase [Chlorobiaceae bacterium]